MLVSQKKGTPKMVPQILGNLYTRVTPGLGSGGLGSSSSRLKVDRSLQDRDTLETLKII